MGLTTSTTNLLYARNELIKVGVSFTFDKVADMIYYMLANNDVTTDEFTGDATWATAGATGRPFAVNLTTNVSLGSYANVFKANADLSAVGGSTGLFSVGNFEVTMPTTGIAGTTAGVEVEITYGATCGALQKPCFFYLNTSGTAVGDFDTYGDIMKIQGVTAATGKVVGAGTSTLRIGTGALAATKRYIPLSTAGDSFTTAYPIVSTSYQTITNTGPTAAMNGFYSLITANAAWTTGSLAAVRGRTNVSTTGAGGNVYGGWFGINFTAATTGLGLSTGLYAQAGSDVAAVKVSSVLHACLTGGASAVMTDVPILVLQDNVTGTQTNLLLEVGFHAGGSTVTTGAKSSTTMISTGLTEATAAAHITAGLRIRANNTVYWLALMDSSALA